MALKHNNPLNPLYVAEKTLEQIARKELGSSMKKVVGDYAYRSANRHKGKYKYVKLWGGKPDALDITIFYQ